MPGKHECGFPGERPSDGCAPESTQKPSSDFVTSTPRKRIQLEEFQKRTLVQRTTHKGQTGDRDPGLGLWSFCRVRFELHENRLILTHTDYPPGRHHLAHSLHNQSQSPRLSSLMPRRLCCRHRTMSFIIIMAIIITVSRSKQSGTTRHHLRSSRSRDKSLSPL